MDTGRQLSACRKDLVSFWKQEERETFCGWDFSHLAGRWREEPLPFDYAAIVQAHLKPRDKLLDMGTGGGEFLLSLHHPGARTCVTEAYPPNIKLCRQRLTPRGIDVRTVENDTELPFATNTFDVIINRHEAFIPGPEKCIGY